jgi:hypothetical protein
MQTPTALSTDRLEIYLNDHLLAATAGLELARRTASSNAGGEFGPPLRTLADELEEDRDELVATIGRLGHRVDRLKVALGWSGEKLGRLKPNGQLTGYSPLSRLLEIEALTGGTQARRALWSAVAAVEGEADAETAGRRAALIARADEQLRVLQDLQARAARLALVD